MLHVCGLPCWQLLTPKAFSKRGYDLRKISLFSYLGREKYHDIFTIFKILTPHIRRLTPTLIA